MEPKDLESNPIPWRPKSTEPIPRWKNDARSWHNGSSNETAILPYQIRTNKFILLHLLCSNSCVEVYNKPMEYRNGKQMKISKKAREKRLGRGGGVPWTWKREGEEWGCPFSVGLCRCCYRRSPLSLNRPIPTSSFAAPPEESPDHKGYRTGSSNW